MCKQRRAAGAGDRHRPGVAMLAVLGWFWLVGGAWAGTLTVTFDRDTITLGESAVMSLTFEGGQPMQLPTLPDLPDLNISSPPGQESRMSIINGVMNSTFALTYTVTPTKAGEFTIPAISATVAMDKVTSAPVKLTVLKPGAAPPAPAPGANAPPGASDIAFMKFLVPKRQIYLGEVMQIDFQIYVQRGARGTRTAPEVQAEGFTTGKVVERDQTQAAVGDRLYTVLPFSMLVTAAKVGSLKLGPASSRLDLITAVDFFGNPTRKVPFLLTNDAVDVVVLPLPKENVPDGFSGAVGDYKLAVSASPTNVAVGDPVTLTVQISGRGAVDQVTLPVQTGWDHFKFYPPTTDYQPIDPLGTGGTKTFKITAVPDSMDLKATPPYRFSYFDTEKRSYETLVQPPIPLTIRPSAASAPPPQLTGTGPSTDNPSATRDIVPIKQRPGALAQISAPLAVRPWFVLLQGVPVVVWVALLARRRQQEWLAGNPRELRRREVEHTVRSGLGSLRKSAAANETAEFYAMLFRLLQERLGERLDVQASGITESVIDDRLRPLGVEEQTLEGVRELFHACNQARYGGATSGEAMAALIPTVETVLEELKEVKV